jgi:hypothetical protein
MGSQAEPGNQDVTRLPCNCKERPLSELRTPEKFAYKLHTPSPGVSLNDIDYFVERETGFEPATSTLARLHSTTELFPQHRNIYYRCGASVNPIARAAIERIRDTGHAVIPRNSRSCNWRAISDIFAKVRPVLA